jgi:putative methyltransferase (TIGR04325 family)
VSDVPLGARVRLAVKAITPPVVWQALKAVKDRRRPAPDPSPPPPAPAEEEPGPAPPPEWEYVPDGWARAPAQGWDVEAVARAYRDKWPSYVEALRGPGPLGVYHEVPAGERATTHDAGAQTMLLAYAYVLALAAHGRDRISLLDWGGGLGHYLVLSRAVLPHVEVDYHCKELPKVVEHGREVLPEATFHVDDSCLERRYDLVLVSGSLQYSEDWQRDLARLGAAAEGYLYVTRLPAALAAPSFTVLQRANAYGYDTEYLGWVINREELLSAAGQAELELVREFLLQAWFSAAGAPEEPVEHRGFLFRPTRSG